ncbi:hypothetical protein ACJRO7_017179 [Eucalyptus globulus]|uniref:Legume lectin domain-containing protein n=1 Tax=Eucalyptus globulus TaxID=34317 RepID=A0ABD3KPI8_EUCGL
MSFNFQVFDGRIVPKGDASQLPSRVQLTISDRNLNLNSSVGRATYHEPMCLWDKSTSNMADFTTQFSFVIGSEHNETFADGLTFFLGPNGSDFASNSSGGNLALVSVNRNPSDPSTTFHRCGIRHFLGLVRGQNHERWTHNASISYNSRAQDVSVLMIDATDPKRNIAKHSHSVNLTEYLPEWMTVGFSVTTGLSFESHSVLMGI